MSDDPAIIARALALRDVELDWYSATGYRAIMIDHTRWNPAVPVPHVVFAGYDVASEADGGFLERTFNLTSGPSACNLTAGREAHCLAFFPGGFPWNGAWQHIPAIVSAGNGTRGSIYAAYALAEHVLGANPWWRFAEDGRPPYRGSTDVAVGAETRVWAPPTFRYRAWFHNDEELLGFYARDPLGAAVFDAATVDALCETLLRAKGNAILMGTTPYPDEKSLALVGRRGIAIVAGQHFTPMSFNAFQWYQALGGTSLWDWRRHPDLIGHVLQASAQSVARAAAGPFGAADTGAEVLWSIGLRGLNDYAYSGTGHCSGDADCSEQINTCIANQTRWIRDIRPPPGAGVGGSPSSSTRADDLLLYCLWAESLGYYQKGLLHIPEEAKILFTDGGAGRIDGLQPIADGVYYHLQYLNGGAGQLTEYVAPARIFEQLSNYLRVARSATVFLLNLSDLKPCVMGAAAAMHFVWNPDAYRVPAGDAGGGRAQQGAFLRAWAAQQFRTSDTTLLDGVAQLWEGYFTNLTYISAGESDEHVAGVLGGLADGLAGDLAAHANVSAKTAAAARSALAFAGGALPAATSLHAAAEAIAASGAVPPARAPFFAAHGLLQTAMQRHSLEAVAHLAHAALNVTAPAPSPANRSAAAAAVGAALASMDALFAAERAAEGSGLAGPTPWRGLYWADRHRFTNFQARRRQVRHVATALRGDPFTHDDVMIDCCQTEYAYQRSSKRQSSFPGFYNSTDYLNALDFVQITFACSNTTTPGARCENGPDGGTWWGAPSSAVVFTARRPDLHVIFYTVDGSSDPRTAAPPTRRSWVPAASPSPLVLNATTTIKAVAVGVGETLADIGATRLRVATFYCG